MTTYFIAHFDVTDDARYAAYGTGALPLVTKHKGTVITADRAVRTLEGPPPGMTLVIAFPSEADALGFYDDPDYQPLKAIRHAATTNRSLVLSSSA